MRDALQGVIAVSYLTNYDMDVAKMLCAGVDVWLNTPLPPMEASGTSGMKAAMNGVPESECARWLVDRGPPGRRDWLVDRRSGGCLPGASVPEWIPVTQQNSIRKLEEKVLPCFYKDRERFIEIMRHTIALNGAFSNTQRMVAQYLHDAYRLGQAPVQQSPGSA